MNKKIIKPHNKKFQELNQEILRCGPHYIATGSA
jgi:hypothetical protein